MKKLIILTGPSGCGKTTTWYPALAAQLNAIAVPTGGVFQSLYANALTGQRVDYTLTGEAALIKYFYGGDHIAGLNLYEKAKRLGTINGHTIVRFIECMRAACPDLPARLVSVIIRNTPRVDAVFVSDAINDEELGHLRALVANDVETFTVSLGCSDPVRRNGDNRTPANRCGSLELDYSLKDLDSNLSSFVSMIKSYSRIK